MGTLGGKMTTQLADGRAVVLRDASVRDARDVARFIDEIAAEPETPLLAVPGSLTARHWKAIIADARGDAGSLSVVAVANGRLVGNLGLHPDPQRASAHVRLLGMSVARDWRGAGLGSALLEAAIGWAAREGVAKIVLSVFAHNTRARAFYARHGFAEEGLRKAQFLRLGQALDEVLMARFGDATWTAGR